MATEPSTAHLQLPAAEDVGMSLLRHGVWFIMKSNEKSDQLVVCQPFQTGGVAGGRSHYTEATGGGTMDRENGDA